MLTLLVVVIVVQLIWWVLINPLFHQSPMPEVVTLANAQVAPLDQPNLALLREAEWRSTTLTFSECCVSPYYGLKLELPIAANMPRDVGLIINVGADNYWVYVNGVAVRAPGQLAPSTYHGLRKGILFVPKTILRPSANEVVILTARNSLYYTDVFKGYAGDYQELLGSTRWRQFVVGELRLINTTIPLMIALIALLLVFQARNRAFLLALVALALVWGLRNGYYLWESYPFSDIARRSYYAWITNALPLTWFAFVHYWAGSTKPSHGWSRTFAALVLLWVIAGLVTTTLLAIQGVPGVEAGERIIEMFGVLVTLLAAVRMLSHLFVYPERRPWEAALLLLCMTTFAIEMAEYFFGQFGSTSSAHSASLFLLAFVVAIIARNVQLFESMESFNQSLNLRLAASEAEIRKTYLSLEAANRSATLSNERQRLLQDMHDGIGGQLVALLAVVRGAPKDLTMVEQVLSETLEDLRLIIDSLDTSTDDLAVALGIFRSRLEPRLISAGYQSRWQFDALPLGLYCPPAQVLHLYRILQEAVSNVLKHADANSLVFTASVEVLPDSGRKVRVSLADDGQWQGDVAGRSGQGLRSMRRRVEALSGNLDIERTTGGTTVAVVFILGTDAPANIDDSTLID